MIQNVWYLKTFLAARHRLSNATGIRAKHCIPFDIPAMFQADKLHWAPSWMKLCLLNPRHVEIFVQSLTLWFTDKCSKNIQILAVAYLIMTSCGTSSHSIIYFCVIVEEHFEIMPYRCNKITKKAWAPRVQIKLSFALKSDSVFVRFNRWISFLYTFIFFIFFYLFFF